MYIPVIIYTIYYEAWASQKPGGVVQWTLVIVTPGYPFYSEHNSHLLHKLLLLQYIFTLVIVNSDIVKNRL